MTVRSMRGFVLFVFIVLGLGTVLLPEVTIGQRPVASDTWRDLMTVLPSPSPHASLGDNAKLFDQFVGTWDSDYVSFAPDGTATRRRGEVIFGWIIDGWALQDVWITYPDGHTAPGQRDIGTSIRLYDPRLAQWRIVWVHPASGVLITLRGGAVGDRIVLRGTPGDGSDLRWSFNEIRRDSVIWRGERSLDGGQTWQVRSEHRLRRRGRS